MENEAQYPMAHDTDNLCRLWQHVLEEQGSEERTLWIGYFDPEGVKNPVVVGIDDMPRRPEAGDTANVRGMLLHLADMVAQPPSLMFSRPGDRRVTGADREWAGVISGLQRDLGVELPVLRGVGTHVAPIPIELH